MAAKIKGDRSGSRFAVMGFRGRRFKLRSRGSPGVWIAAHGRIIDRPGRENSLVQFVRSAESMACDHTSSRSGRFGVLPALLHGVAQRGRFAQASVTAFF